jgi:hypothetical protein
VVKVRGTVEGEGKGGEEGGAHVIDNTTLK